MTPRFQIAISLVLCTTLGAFTGCDGSSSGTTASNTTSPAMVIPAAHFMSGEKPANAPMLTEVKAASKISDKVMFEARVGGRAKVFVDDMAIFLAADPRLVSCDQRPGDHCPVPWDYCCENADALKKGMATIQIIDDAGLPYEVTAEGQGGIEPLKTVVVTGIVSAKDPEGNFVVDASSVWVGTIPADPPGSEDDHDHDHG